MSNFYWNQSLSDVIKTVLLLKLQHIHQIEKMHKNTSLFLIKNCNYIQPQLKTSSNVLNIYKKMRPRNVFFKKSITNIRKILYKTKKMNFFFNNYKKTKNVDLMNVTSTIYLKVKYILFLFI